jgi:hypothetical protein
MIDNNMELCEQLIMDFSVKMREVFTRQATDETYLNRKDFDNCMARATAGYNDAIRSGRKILALAIALHEEKNHSNDPLPGLMDEQAVLMESMSSEEVEMSTMGFWMD